MHFEILLIICWKDTPSLFLSCYVVGNCACRSWFLMNSKWNTRPIKFKLMKKVYDVCMNDWNKVSQNITEEFLWESQWPVKKTTRYIKLQIYKHFTFINLFKDLASYSWRILTVSSGSWSCPNFRTWWAACDLGLVVDEDQSQRISRPDRTRFRLWTLQRRGRHWTVRMTFDFPDCSTVNSGL